MTFHNSQVPLRVRGSSSSDVKIEFLEVFPGEARRPGFSFTDPLRGFGGLESFSQGVG